MFIILHFLNNYLINFLLLLKIFFIEIFFDDYNLMRPYIYTFVPSKNNKFKGKKFFLTNLPFNLKNTKEFKFKNIAHFTNDINNISKNNILIINVNNLYKFTNKYFDYDKHNIFYDIDFYQLKNNFGGLFFINQNFNKNIFKYKFIWYFSEQNFSGYLFNTNLIY